MSLERSPNRYLAWWVIFFPVLVCALLPGRALGNEKPLAPGSGARVEVPAGPPADAVASAVWHLEKPGVYTVTAVAEFFDVVIRLSASLDYTVSDGGLHVESGSSRLLFETAEPGIVEVEVLPADFSDWGGVVRIDVESGMADPPKWSLSPLKTLQHWANLVEKYNRQKQRLKLARALIYQSRAAYTMAVACQQKRSWRCDKAFVYSGFYRSAEETTLNPDLPGVDERNSFSKRHFFLRTPGHARGTIGFSYMWACQLLAEDLRLDHPYLAECRREFEEYGSSQLGQSSVE